MATEQLKWPVFKLGDLCDSVDYGYTQSATRDPVGPHFLRITDISSGSIDWSLVPFCEIPQNLFEKYRLNSNDIVIARTGATTGVCAFIKEQTTAVFASYLIRLRIKSTVSARFIYYCLKSPRYWEYIAGVLGDKSAQPNASATTLTQVSFPVPPLSEQCAITSILGALDDKIELNRQMNKTLESIAQALFKHWFIDFEFPNENGQPYKSSGGEMVDSELRGIPKGWEVGYLGDGILTTLSKVGIDRFRGEKIYLDTASVRDSEVVDIKTRITFEKRPSRANMQPIINTVWFAKMKNSKKIILFDKFTDYELKNYILSTGFAGLTVKDYALYYIWSFISRDRFELEKDNLCNGTTMQAINNENIMKLKILIPPKEILLKFNELLTPAYQQISYVNRNNRTLINIRDSLLPKLMSGKIRVPLEEKNE